jgi:Rrf2 family protein
VLSKKTQYALMAMTSLAREYRNGPVLVSRLADEGKIPKDFLNLILLELKNHGLVQSRRGKKGGYVLSRPPDHVSLASIIRLIGGPLAPVPCVSASVPGSCDICRDEETCGLRQTMKEVRDATARILEQTSLADVVTRADALEQARANRAASTKREALNYFI